LLVRGCLLSQVEYLSSASRGRIPYE
jgi:hypothetical protein